MPASQHLIFKSNAFPPIPEEDYEVNPGIYGKALVDWLVQSLTTHGREVSRLVCEDFARLIQMDEPSCNLYIAVSSTDDTATEWRVFVFAEAGLLARLKGKGSDRAAKVKALFEQLRTILSADNRIRDLSIEN